MPIRNCREPWLSRGRLDSLYQMVHWLVLVCFKQANAIFVLSRMVQMAQHSTANIAILLFLQTVRWLYHTPGLGC